MSNLNAEPAGGDVYLWSSAPVSVISRVAQDLEAGQSEANKPTRLEVHRQLQGCGTHIVCGSLSGDLGVCVDPVSRQLGRAGIQVMAQRRRDWTGGLLSSRQR